MKNENRIFFKGTVGVNAYGYTLIKNVKVFDINQEKGGKYKYLGTCDHVLVGKKKLKKFQPGTLVKGVGEVYRYQRGDGTYDFSFKIKNLKDQH